MEFSHALVLRVCVGFPKKYADRWIGNNKLALGVNVCVNDALKWTDVHVPSRVLLHAQHSRDVLWIHCNIKDKTVTKEE